MVTLKEVVWFFAFVMSLLKYFKPSKEGLSTAESLLSSKMTAAANKAVQEVLEKQDVTATDSKDKDKKKRVYNTTFTDEDRAAIGKHAAEHGNAAAVRQFKWKYSDLGESTVRSFKRRYLGALEERRKAGDDVPVVSGLSVQKTRKKAEPWQPGQPSPIVHPWIAQVWLSSQYEHCHCCCAGHHFISRQGSSC